MVAGGMLAGFEDDDQYDVPNTLAATMDPKKSAQHRTGLALAAGRGPRRASQAAPYESAPNIIYLMSVLSAMGGFLFGYDTGIVSGAMVFVRKQFNLNSLWQEIVVSITILGAWILSLMAGSLSERYGRKTMILYASVIFTIGSIVMGFAWSKYILLYGRLIVGIAIGLASTVVPMYIAEVAPSNIRGSLVTLNNCFITFGQLSAAITAGAFSYDHENGWRWMLALAAAPAVVQFCGFMFMPESPRWLIRRGRDEEALAALKRIRGHKNPNMLREFDKIKRNQLELQVQEDRRKAQKRNIIVAILRKTATRRALFVGCLLQATQQLAGINTVMYYTATIIEMSGVQSQSIAVWLAVPTAAVYVIFSFCGYLLADRMGRRTLTLGSLMGVIISLLVLGTGFQLTSMNEAHVTAHNMSTAEICYSKRDCSACIAEPRCGFCYDAQNFVMASCIEKDPDDATRSVGGECGGSPGAGPLAAAAAAQAPASNFVLATHICPSMSHTIGLNTWMVLTGLVMYLAAFAPGMSPMPWTINSEIYPMWARSFCYSISTSVNWMFNLLISLTFISLTEVLTTHGAFYMYSIIASICWLLLFWKLPETRGRSLEDISELFAKPKPEDHLDMMDDGTSANQSTMGTGGNSHNINMNNNTVNGQQQASTPAPVCVSGSPATPNVMFRSDSPQGGRRNSAVGATPACHDNLAFAGDTSGPAARQQQLPEGLQASLVERHRSFKLGSPLSKATNMAISQPDLQSSQAQQVLHQHQAGHHTQQQQQHQQQHAHYQPKRKYSDGGGAH